MKDHHWIALEALLAFSVAGRACRPAPTGRSRHRPQPPASVAEFQTAHDRALLRDRWRPTSRAKPKAEDLDQAYLDALRQGDRARLVPRLRRAGPALPGELPRRPGPAAGPDRRDDGAGAGRAVRRGARPVPGADGRPGQARAGGVRRQVHRLAGPGRQRGRAPTTSPARSTRCSCSATARARPCGRRSGTT